MSGKRDVEEVVVDVLGVGEDQRIIGVSVEEKKEEVTEEVDGL